MKYIWIGFFYIFINSTAMAGYYFYLPGPMVLIRVSVFPCIHPLPRMWPMTRCMLNTMALPGPMVGVLTPI